MTTSRRNRVACVLMAASVLFVNPLNVMATDPPGGDESESKFVLVVDPGHGGSDMGCSAGQLKEKDLCLRLAKRLQELAPQHNIDVKLTRESDMSMSLAERIKFGNEFHPHGFISLHINDQKGSSEGGIQIAVNNKGAQAERSGRLAFAIHRELDRPEWKFSNVPTENSVYVLKENEVPALLIEFGDIKNNEQMQYLTDNAKLDKVCYDILRGVTSYRMNDR